MKKCRYCKAIIKDEQPYFMCQEAFVQRTYYLEDDDSDNAYCSKDCFCEDMMLAEVFE